MQQTDTRPAVDADLKVRLDMLRIDAAAKIIAHRHTESFTGRILRWDELSPAQQQTARIDAAGMLCAADNIATSELDSLRAQVAELEGEKAKWAADNEGLMEIVAAGAADVAALALHVEGLREALESLVKNAGHHRVFLTSRQKIHQDGLALWEDDIERADEALSLTPPETSAVGEVVKAAQRLKETDSWTAKHVLFTAVAALTSPSGGKNNG